MDKMMYAKHEHSVTRGRDQQPRMLDDRGEDDGPFPYEEEESYSSSKSIIFKVFAVICLLAFMALSFPNLIQLFRQTPSFLSQSRELSSQELVKLSLPAIVKVEAVQVNDILSSTRQQGTGFNIQPTGLVVTNQHVVEKSREVKISFADGSTFFSSKVKKIPGLDLALVEFQGNNLPSLSVNTEKVPDRASVLTIIGNPAGYLQVPVRGPLLDYVSVPGTQSPVMVIQAPIAPGSSGSPVFNTQGQVVAVVFAYNHDSAKGTDQALAIPLSGLSGELAPAALP